ncbi:unnamed protein product [Symbiodinium natans]|uniref:EF-hand domain-containing protein n=1 Tax=Symbiodinium natans TaxID=878477 RepID=A0A812JNG8_9DINO|nr:unnamed protein product [Symbiodinium natans]
MPTGVKKVLHELDLDSTGIVDEKNLEDSLRCLKHLKNGLDTDGSGHVSNAEMEDGVALLTKLMKEKSQNSSEMPYKHLPECIQEVMREWDADGSGMVGVSELSAAAHAYKKVQQEGRMMKKIILGLSMVILLLMIGMFILSYAAAEMAKEMRGDGDAIMANSQGMVVKVASSDFEMTADGTLIIRGAGSANASCPANQTCRRLQGKDSKLQVANSETPRRLSSTLPDASFKELKSLTLKDNLGHALKVTITSFQRLSLRSSKCGSVIHLNGDHGRLTLDDYDMTADPAMEAYVKDAGMEGLFEDGPISGFGRRLSSTDGLLEGFFNMLEDIEWACESVDLPNPNDMPQFYYAKMHVKHLHGQPERGYSQYFTDEEGNFLTVPGVIVEDGKVYKTWTEELVKSASLTAYMSHFAMHPFQRELRLKRSGENEMQAKIEAVGKVGYRCLVESPQKSTIAAAAENAMPSLEFRGVVVENGTVLRHWRMDPMGDLEREGNMDAHEMQVAMLEAGLIPNVIDYFDVDTDPSGKFESGQPFRVRMYSTVKGSKVDTTKQYVEIVSLPSAFEIAGMFDYFNVSMLDGGCAYSRELQKERNISNTSNVSMAAAMLVEEVQMLNRTNRSSTSADFKPPPEINPWSEYPTTVAWNFDELKKRASAGQLKNGALALARTSKYWDAIFTLRENQVELDSHRFYDQFADTYNVSDNMTFEPNMSNYPSGGRRLSTDGRRLLARRLGRRTPIGDDGSYFVEIDDDDLKPHHPDHPMRRLAARRLDDDDNPFWKYKAWVTPEKIDIEVEVGKAKLQFLVQYCNLWNPTVTNWGACQTGRAGAGDIVKLEAYCSGRQIMFPFPKVQMELGGLLVYDDTSAMGIDTDVNMYMSPVAARGKVLRMDGWSYKFARPGDGGTTFSLKSADGGIGVIGSDARVWIRNSGGRYIQDNKGNPRVTSNNRGWEKFHVLDAGGGMVYLRSHRGEYLGIRETSPQPNPLECTVTLFRDRRCRGGTQTHRSTNSVLGQEWRGWGRRRWGTSADEWRSARATGHCRLVEFYDEDEDTSGYEDNLFESGNFDCVDFPNDIDEDLGGLKIQAVGPDPPEFEGDLVLYSSKDHRTQWYLTKTDEAGGSIVSFGDALLYGGLTFSKEVEIIWGIGASWTTEIGAAGAYHSKHGVYLAEVYGKTIFEITPAQIYLPHSCTEPPRDTEGLKVTGAFTRILW